MILIWVMKMRHKTECRTIVEVASAPRLHPELHLTSASSDRHTTMNTQQGAVLHMNMMAPQEVLFPQQDQTFWFDDGNLVIIAGMVAFRVYNQLLLRHSPVFEQIYSQPPPPDMALYRTLYNCHVIRVDDTPLAIRTILSYYIQDPQDLPLYASGVERAYFQVAMGLKYQMYTMVEEACDLVVERIFDTDSASYLRRWSDPERAFDASQAFIGIVLARMIPNGRTSILPTAILIVAAGLNPTQLQNGVRLSDGTHLELSLDDLAVCLDARHTLLTVSLAVGRFIFASPWSRHCYRPGSGMCGQSLTLLTDQLLTRYEDARLISVDPFKDWAQELSKLPDEGKLCGPCTEMIKKRQEKILKKAWGLLPCFLDITVHGWNPNECLRHCQDMDEKNKCTGFSDFLREVNEGCGSGEESGSDKEEEEDEAMAVEEEDEFDDGEDDETIP
ncbi:hypothetical protein BD413DRAFT_224958 [Trametes elegans]|nr:hypothetical protein BD413DRAFT_224958 [Trametes elegans]